MKVLYQKYYQFAGTIYKAGVCAIPERAHTGGWGCAERPTAADGVERRRPNEVKQTERGLWGRS